MPGLTAQPAAVMLAAVVLAVAGLTVLTAVVLSQCLKRHAGADSLFWYGFSGFFSIFIVVTAAAAMVPGSAQLVTAAALLSAGVAGGWIWRGEHERAGRRRREAADARLGRLHDRHALLLQQWVTYELDPASTIDFPAMTDPSQPETALMIRAMRRAAVERARLDDDGDPQSAAAYEAAVSELERSFRAAERAAGVSPPGPAWS